MQEKGRGLRCHRKLAIQQLFFEISACELSTTAGTILACLDWSGCILLIPGSTAAHGRFSGNNWSRLVRISCHG